ncbi:MAG TPA: hypothetical protein VI111_00530 [Thermoleophilaceae bacterium]
MARVAGQTIPRSQVTHFLRAECLKLERLHPRSAPAHGGATEPFPCAGQYVAALRRVMRLLITTRWYRSEARRLGIELTASRLRTDLTRLQRARFIASQLSLDQFQRRTGLSRRDLELLVEWPRLRAALAPASGDALDASLVRRYRPQTQCASAVRVSECGSIYRP